MCVREAVTFFSVCIPGNCSAALLNNETSAYMYVSVCVCVCCVYVYVWVGGEKKKKQ